MILYVQKEAEAKEEEWTKKMPFEITINYIYSCIYLFMINKLFDCEKMKIIEIERERESECAFKNSFINFYWYKFINPVN